MINAGHIGWQMPAYVIGSAVIIGANLWKHATVGWKPLDTACIAIVIVTMTFWGVSHNNENAIMMILFAAVIGMGSLLRNIARNPAHEPLLPWVITLIGGAFGVLAIESWTITGALTQVVFLICQLVAVALISREYVQRAAT